VPTTFLHPWALVLGAAALALPWVIHWLTRPRPRRLPLSTVRFVQEAIRQRRARHRLRDLIVLALRSLAILLLAWTLARPLAENRPLVTPDESATSARVVIVDVSQSMAAGGNGVQLFERARSVAAGYLGDSASTQANLILAGASAQPSFDTLSTNFTALRDELARASVRPERLNVQAALNRASELLAASGSERVRELVVVSDFQRSSWATADFSVLPEQTRIQLDSVAPAETLPNLAILRVGSEGRPEQGRELRVEVEVGNFSPTARPIQVELSVGDSVFHLEGHGAAGGKTILATDVPLHSPGWQRGTARLLDVSDALPADDVRSFVVEVGKAPSYALITRQRASQRASSSYYLERALAPAPRNTRTEPRVRRIDPERLDREMLGSADVIVLDHPGKLTGEVSRLLVSFLRRGRGILYVASEVDDAANLQILAEAAGSDWQLPVDFVPPAAGERRRGLFLAEVRRDQAPFAVFGDGYAGLVGPLRFTGALSSRRRESGSADDVLAAYSDRSAGLVVTSCGAGSMAVLNADLVASNLPASPAFVPLIGELTGRLLGQQRMTEILPCGEARALYLPGAAGPAAGLSISGPPGAALEGSALVEESSGVLWHVPALQTPGIYEVKRNGKAVFAVAAAAPAEESDLKALDPSVFQGRLSGGRSLHFRSAAGIEAEARDSLWIWLGVACVICLLGEIVALKLFRV
jgi:hypothetical protein